MNNEKELLDYNFEPSDFELVQTKQKISDTKMESKPTTFFKDSIKRFCKNKSSIVGAFILGFLVLLAIFVPMFSTANITAVSKQESHLAPKLFESGTGFWDGTVKYEDVVYDSINNVPADFYGPAVVEGTLKVDSEPSYIDQANDYGTGGYVMFAHEKYDGEDVDNKFLYTSKAQYTSTANYKVNVSLFDKNDVHYCQQGEYRIYLEYDIGVDPETSEILKNQIVLKDWTTDYTNFELNISNALVENNITSVEANFVIELKPVEDNYSYILIESVVFSSDETNEIVSGFSFEDATKMVLEPKDLEGSEDSLGYKKPNPAYWFCTGRKGVHNSQVYFCSFTYDTYVAAYDAQIKTVAASDFQTWIDQGLCTLDFEVEKFKNDKKLYDEFGAETRVCLGNLALKMKYWEQNIYSGEVERIEWRAGKSKLTPVAVIKGGTMTSTGSTVRNVPLYAPCYVLMMEAYPGNTIHFRFGGEAGVVPCLPNGKILTDKT